MNNQEFQDIFDTYALALEDKNIAKINTFHASPWILVKGDEHYVIDNEGVFVDNMLTALNNLAEQGIVQFGVNVKKVLKVTDKNILVNVSWFFSTEEGEIKREFSTSYLFFEEGEEKSIMSVVIDENVTDMDISLFG